MAGLKQLNWASEGVGATAAALVDLSTVAGNKISNPPWVKFQSAGWVNFPSAPTDNSTFALGTVHILYGKGILDRTPEITALADYWQWMGAVYPGTERILVGDFNLPPDNPAWTPLKKYAKPLITRGASTLSSKDGKFASLYDNIWISRDSKLPIKKVGIVNYPKMIGWDHEKSRKHASDHAPVYMTLGQGKQIAFPIVAANAPTRSASTFAAVSAGSVFKKLTTSEKPSLPAAANIGSVRGNRNSKVYHRPNCPSYNSIGMKNRIEFDSASAAQTAGYHLAGNCH